jgi:4-amino-4-deoxy-L-arabinose transferase-like glycosyltransferase
VTRPGSAAGGLVLLLVAVAALYSARLDHTPPHLHRDEAVFALQSISVAKTGRDIDGRLLPLYFEMRLLREHVWFQPMLVYLTAPVLAVVQPSQAVFRMPSVAIGVVDVLLVFLVARRLFRSRRWAYGAAILLAATPAHMIHSRMAMDFIYPLPFVLGWLWCLLDYLERRRLPILFAATSLLGIGFYSYIASVMMMPIYLGLTCLALLAASERSLRPYLVAAAGFAWPLLAIAAWLPSHTGVVADTLGRYHIGGGILRPTALTDRISVYWRFFDPAFLFLIGGYTRLTNSTRLVGVFLAPLLVLIPLGAIRAATTRRTPFTVVLLLGFLLAPLAAVIAVPEEPYASDRELAVLVFGVLLAMLGIEALAVRGTPWARRTLAALLAVVPLHFAFFVYDYFGDYHRRAAFWYDWNHLGALETAIGHAGRRGAPVLLSNGDDTMMEAFWRLALAMHGREDLLGRTIYVDGRRIRLDQVPAGAVMVVTKNDTAARALVDSGALREIAAIPEPADPPYYIVLERQTEPVTARTR